MAKLLSGWKKLSVYMRAFFILAFVFLLVGMGTLGTVKSAGKGYELKSKGEAAVEPAIVFRLSNLVESTESGSKTTYLAVVDVLVNMGAIYAEEGAVAQLRLGRSLTTSGTFTNRVEANLENFYQAVEEGKEPVKAASDVLYNWTSPFPREADGDSETNRIPAAGWRVDSYPYYMLTARNCNVLINEIVFIGEKLKYENSAYVGTGEYCIVPTEIYEGEKTVLVYNAEAGETRADALKKAQALLDAQQIPTLSQSSFFRFGQEEVASLMTTEAILSSGTYDGENTGLYFGDRTYNALGVDLLALGPAIFGMSPFGLRFFPMLASFGVLVAGFLFVRRLFKSDKAGFAFALLYSLCGLSLSLGHLGTPLMFGVFFFMMSLLFMHKFYSSGMKRADALSAAPLGASGLFAAAAVCVNGAFLIPVVGVIALFVCGMLRQQIAKRYYLEKVAAEEKEAEPAAASAEETPALKARTKMVKEQFRYKNIMAPAVFGLTLILGIVVMALIAALPASFAYVRLYDDPASPTLNVFNVAWKAFAAGFTGSGMLASSPSAWNIFYEIFRGAGDMYAVTFAVINFAALLAAVGGIVYAVWSIVSLLRKGERSKEDKRELRGVIILLAGLVISLVTASFAGGGLAFLLSAYIFAFVLASGAVRRFTEAEGRLGKAAKITCIVGMVALALVFALFAVFTFSIPLPASLMGTLVG